ncbi:hypothetical protein OROMI_015788 [Orobanche minor]
MHASAECSTKPVSEKVDAIRHDETYKDVEVGEDNDSETDRINEMMHDVEDHFTERSHVYDIILRAAKKPLYEGCTSYSKFSAVLKLFNLKAIHSWTDYTVVENSAGNASMCGMPRYKRKESDGNSRKQGKGIPAKVLWYLPIISRFKRLFADAKTAELLRWHADGRKDDGLMRHPSDSVQWRNTDQKYETFSEDIRNLRLGLYTDGMNPFGTLNTQYSTWPVLLTIYDLPHLLCMKRRYIMLSLLISGPKQPANDINVYLAPLIEDLKLLWDEGVTVYDAYSRMEFTLRAMIFCTINNFPAYGNLSGYTVKGKEACPICIDDMEERKKRKGFNGKVEKKVARLPLRASQIYERVKDIEIEFGKPYKSNSVGGFKKRAIFWELPYWKNLEVPHSIDIMHVEKNVCDAVVGTLLNIRGKTKDEKNARLDMKEMGRPELAPKERGKRYYLPPACFTLSGEEKKSLCESLHGVKFNEEVSSWCAQYLAGANKIGVPQSRHEGRFQGKGTIGRKVIQIDGYLKRAAELFILQNLTEVHSYVEEHLTFLGTKYPSRSNNALLNLHTDSFLNWFKENVTSQLSVSPDVSDTLRWLAYGCDVNITSYQGYDINGYSFYTKRQDDKLTVQNSGVIVVAFSQEYASSRDKTLVDKQKSYYNVIEEIYELRYLEGKRRILGIDDVVDEQEYDEQFNETPPSPFDIPNILDAIANHNKGIFVPIDLDLIYTTQPMADDGEAEGSQHSEQISGNSKKSGRGPARGLKSKLRVVREIAFDKKIRPIGPQVNPYKKYLGHIARTKVSILIENWEDVPQGIKDSLWLDAQDIWKQKANDGEFVPTRSDDILAHALETIEQPGHVRGVGGAFGYRTYWGPSARQYGNVTPPVDMNALKAELKKEIMVDILADLRKQGLQPIPKSSWQVTPTPIVLNKSSCQSGGLDPFINLKGQHRCKHAIMIGTKVAYVAEGTTHTELTLNHYKDVQANHAMTPKEQGNPRVDSRGRLTSESVIIPKKYFLPEQDMPSLTDKGARLQILLSTFKENESLDMGFVNIIYRGLMDQYGEKFASNSIGVFCPANIADTSLTKDSRAVEKYMIYAIRQQSSKKCILCPYIQSIHTKKRERLEHQRLNDLVYIQYNRKIATRFQKRCEDGKNFDPLLLDDFQWDNEWVNGEVVDPGDLDWLAVNRALEASEGIDGRRNPSRSGGGDVARLTYSGRRGSGSSHILMHHPILRWNRILSF